MRGPIMRREVHNGLEDVFTPCSMDGVRACEKIYTQMSSYRMIKLLSVKGTNGVDPVSVTGHVCGSGQGEDQGSVQLFGLG